MQDCEAHQVNLIIFPTNATSSNIYFQVHVSVFHSKNKEVHVWLIEFLGKWCMMNKITLLKLWYMCQHSIHISDKHTLEQVHIWPVGSGK